MDPGGLSAVLKEGMKIDIQRSDGRIHSAVISGVNTDSKSASVEWFEKGETKGKEVEFGVILQLNQYLRELMAGADAAAAKQNGRVEMVGNGEVSARERRVLAGGQQPQEINSARAVTATNMKGPAPQMTRQQTRQQPRKTGVMGKQPSDSTNQYTGIPQVPPAIIEQSDVAFGHPSAAMQPPPPASAVAVPMEGVESAYDKRGKPGGNRGRKSNMIGDAAGVPASGPAAAPGPPGAKSSVVSEIEKIAKRREERRAQQEANRKQMDSEYDRSNPNWEFLRMIREFQSRLEYHPLTNTDVVYEHQICVCVRKRPMNPKEVQKKDIDVVTIPTRDNVIVHEPKTKVDLTKYLENQTFRFDYAFDDSADNECVYKFTARPLVESVFQGGMATCFAYGQTGSGKTHTMGGQFQPGKTGIQDCTNGIYILSARDVFALQKSKRCPVDVDIGVSFFEIYSGKVYDLLREKEKLRVLEDARSVVQVVGLSEERVYCVEDVIRLIQQGNTVRTSGQTSANVHSSRSHAVFQIILRRKPTGALYGKFSLIDLAGNERGADTMSSDRRTRLEGAEINKSLLALKECIRALGRPGGHLPFRASKLTQVLRDSFIGERSKTCMIATLSPGMSCCEHSLNTLRYADRVKELGPGDPLEVQPQQQQQPIQQGFGGTQSLEQPAGNYANGNNCPVSPQNDLFMVRTRNAAELDDDFMAVNEAADHCAEAEESACEEMRGYMETLPRHQREMEQLFRVTRDVDYDQEAFVSRTLAVIAGQQESLQRMEQRLREYQNELCKEEEISKQVVVKKTKTTQQPAGSRRK